MKFLNNIDLHQNEIQNFRVQNLAAAPANPVIGQHYFNTVDNTEYVWNGTKWVDALSQGDYTFADGITEGADRKVTLDKATASAIGGVIVGTNIDVDADGKISVKSGDKTQAGLLGLAADADVKAEATEDAKAITPKQADGLIDTKIVNKIELTDLSATGPITYDNTSGVISAEYDATPTADSDKLMKSKDIKTAIDAVNDGAVVDVELKENTTDTITVTKGDGSSEDIKIAKVDEAANLTDLTATAAELNELHEAGAEKADFVKLHAITATKDEINKLAGNAVTADDLTKLHDVTATAAEINKLAGNEVTADDLTKLHGITATAAELNQIHESEVTKDDLVKLHAVEASASDINILKDTEVTATELGYVHGVTSAIQDQIDDKVKKNADITAGQKCKITYDAKGLVTAGDDLELADIPDLSTVYVNVNQKGVANGVATLDANGLVPSAQLPSFVDDVVDILAVTDTAPAACAKGDKYYNTGDKKIYVATADNTWGEGAEAETDKIYVNLENNMAYRYSGSALVQIGADKLKGFNGAIEGDGTQTSFVINHNLGTRNVVFEIYEAATPYEKVYVQVLHTSTTALTVVFGQAPAVGENYVVTCIAIG